MLELCQHGRWNQYSRVQLLEEVDPPEEDPGDQTLMAPAPPPLIDDPETDMDEPVTDDFDDGDLFFSTEGCFVCQADCDPRCDSNDDHSIGIFTPPTER